MYGLSCRSFWWKSTNSDLEIYTSQTHSHKWTPMQRHDVLAVWNFYTANTSYRSTMEDSLFRLQRQLMHSHLVMWNCKSLIVHRGLYYVPRGQGHIVLVSSELRGMRRTILPITWECLQIHLYPYISLIGNPMWPPGSYFEKRCLTNNILEISRDIFTKFSGMIHLYQRYIGT